MLPLLEACRYPRSRALLSHAAALASQAASSSTRRHSLHPAARNYPKPPIKVGAFGPGFLATLINPGGVETTLIQRSCRCAGFVDMFTFSWGRRHHSLRGCVSFCLRLFGVRWGPTAPWARIYCYHCSPELQCLACVRQAASDVWFGLSSASSSQARLLVSQSSTIEEQEIR